MSADVASAIANTQPLRYAGYALDEHSGLYYLSQRYYDPATFAFITKDPARADGEASAYQYCGGEPVGSVDPSGMFDLLGPNNRSCERSVTETRRGTFYRFGIPNPWSVTLTLKVVWCYYDDFHPSCAGCHPRHTDGVGTKFNLTISVKNPTWSGTGLNFMVKGLKRQNQNTGETRFNLKPRFFIPTNVNSSTSYSRSWAEEGYWCPRVYSAWRPYSKSGYERMCKVYSPGYDV